MRNHWFGGIAAGFTLALIVSQTPWFRDWLRRYIVRESKQYLNGELSIGHLDGNLLFGADLSNVAVDVSGERDQTLKNRFGHEEGRPVPNPPRRLERI